uniref:Tetraspanin 31 n=1 Tax=Oncorhynchus mykiss TaxID=8022 RepID=A0A8C7V3C0_ONCMY
MGSFSLQLVGLLLIGVAAWGKGFGIVSSIHIIGGVIAVGVFLLLISIVGLIGALNHHQVMLFFYMVILFLVFLFQFGVSCSCLAINKGQQVKLLSATWALMSNDTRLGVENKLNCCGLLNNNQSKEQFNEDVKLCNAPCKHGGECFNCGDLMLQHAAEALKILGAVGLFFSFTEVRKPLLTIPIRAKIHTSQHSHSSLNAQRGEFRPELSTCKWFVILFFMHFSLHAYSDLELKHENSILFIWVEI